MQGLGCFRQNSKMQDMRLLFWKIKNSLGEMPYWQMVALDTPSPLMEQVLNFVQSQDVFAWVGAVVALLAAVIAIASLIPGDEPEATLQKVVDFLARFSRK